MPPVEKPKVVKDPAWLRTVRGMPCVNGHLGDCDVRQTLGKGPSEASHLDTKRRDDRVLPMCGRCHRTGAYAWHHGMQTYCRKRGVTKAELIAEAERLYADWRNR